MRSDTVLVVATTPDGFVFTEVPVAPPLLKLHDVVGEVTPPDRRWTDARVAIGDERLIGIASTEYHAWNRRQQLWGLYVDAGHRGYGVGPWSRSSWIEGGATEPGSYGWKRRTRTCLQFAPTG